MKEHKIFESNPTLKEVHLTSDGEAFYNDNDAKMHAKTLKDKSVELVVNPLSLEVITEDAYTDESETFNHLKTGDAIDKQMIGFEATADGSENVLVQTKTEGTPLVNLPELSVEGTQEEINTGGKAINIKETPEVTAPVVEPSKDEISEVNTPVVETPVATTKKGK